jgi:hypothetical protein
MGMAVLVGSGVAVLVCSGVLVIVSVGVMVSISGMGVSAGRVEVGGTGLATDAHALNKVSGMTMRVVLKKSLIKGFFINVT